MTQSSSLHNLTQRELPAVEWRQWGACEWTAEGGGEIFWNAYVGKCKGEFISPVKHFRVHSNLAAIRNEVRIARKKQ